MAFQGDLLNVGLATLFQNLQQGVQTGTLALRRKAPRGGDVERFVFVSEGKVAMVARGGGAETPLGEYLVRAGKVTREDIEAAQKKRRKGTRLSSALERSGAVGDGDVEGAVTEFMEEELHELFTWPDGSFEFRDSEKPEDVFDAEMRNAGVELDPNDIILEAARRVNEWDRINRLVGNLGDIYVVREETAEELERLGDRRAREVAEYLDGSRDVAAVIRDSGQGRFAVLQGLMRLISDRLVRPAAGSELKALAESALSSNRTTEAVSFLRKALEVERNDAALRRRLAEMLEHAGEKDEAASEWKLLAASSLDGDRTREAVEALRRAIALRPSDVTARERLFKILSDSGGKTVAIEAGVELAEACTGLGVSEKAVEALKRLLALNPKDRLSIEKKLVEAQVAIGDVEGAKDTLRRMARRFLKARDYDEAAAFYQELLKLDARDDEARKRIAEIQAGVVERNRERRDRLVRDVVLAAVALPVLVIVLREVWSHPAESGARLAASRVARAAAQKYGRGEAWREQRRHNEAVREFDGAALLYDRAADILQGFRDDWWATFAAAWSAGPAVAEWRSQAVAARLAGADALEKAGRLKDAARAYLRVHRTPGVPKDAARRAEESFTRLKGIVGDFLDDEEGRP